MSIDEKLLQKEIFEQIKKDRVVTRVEILTRQIVKYEEISSEDVSKALKYLIEEEKIMDLYPRNVKPESAGISETYYKLKDPEESIKDFLKQQESYLMLQSAKRLIS